jgi:phospholipid/cholesterol/gamma-HCH transport system substrate-binding protein
MTTRAIEVRVGGAVILAFVVLIMGVTWLKEISLARKTSVWHVRFDQAGGLAAGVAVQVNGIKKGTVQSAQLVGDRVVVDLALANDVQLTDHCRIAIRDLGVMGDKLVAIEMRTGGRAYSPRDTIDGQYDEGLNDLMAQMGDVLADVSRIVRNLQQITGEDSGGGDLAATLKSFRATSEELHRTVAENRHTLQETLQNFSAASRTAKDLTTDREAELRRALEQFSSAAENMNRLTGRLDSLRASIQVVSGRIESGQGTIGKLVQDDQLYTDLTSSVKQLNALIADIKAHPKKYFKVSVF